MVLDHGCDLVLVGDVTDNSENLMASVLQFLLSDRQTRMVDIDEDYRRAPRGESVGRGQAYSRAPARDQRNLIGEIVGGIQRKCPIHPERIGR